MLNKKIKMAIKEKYDNYKKKYAHKIAINKIGIIGIGVVLFFVFYYGFWGAVISSEIRKNVDVKIKPVNGLQTTAVASFIVNQEVQKNLWTPSLPVFFPTYFLDNLPNFQLGEIKAVSVIINSLSTLAKDDEYLIKSAELFGYDGRIWMFDKTGVLPVPSSASQYKKGNQLLKKSNPLANGLMLDEASLSYLIKKISHSLSHSLKNLDKAIIEDEKIDNQFYYNQGKAYVYLLFLKAICVDYKNVLVSNNLYADITSVIKALEDGVSISPSIVKNADKNSSSANHLYNFGYYLQKALLSLKEIEKGLDK